MIDYGIFYIDFEVKNNDGGVALSVCVLYNYGVKIVWYVNDTTTIWIGSRFTQIMSSVYTREREERERERDIACNFLIITDYSVR